jgi:hypothetical protein
MRYFANDNERVTTVMLPGDRTFPQSIGDASVQTGFYTVIDQAGQQSDAAEQAFSLLEADAAVAWREVAAGYGRSTMSTGRAWLRGRAPSPAREQRS